MTTLSAVVEAIIDRLEQFAGLPVAHYTQFLGRHLDGYWWGIIEQASHTLWVSGWLDSPAEANVVLEKVVMDFFQDRLRDPKAPVPLKRHFLKPLVQLRRHTHRKV